MICLPEVSQTVQNHRGVIRRKGCPWVAVRSFALHLVEAGEFYALVPHNPLPPHIRMQRIIEKHEATFGEAIETFLKDCWHSWE